MKAGEYIEKFRKHLGLKKCEFAERLGIYYQAYNTKVKNDTWSTGDLMHTAAVFGYRFVLFFEKDGKPIVSNFSGDVTRYIYDCEIKIFGEENIALLAQKTGKTRECLRVKLVRNDFSSKSIDEFASIFDAVPVFYFLDKNGSIFA